jgi:hypothetical protein
MDPSILLKNRDKRLEDIKAHWSSLGHGHVFQFWDKLTDNEKIAFLNQLEVFSLGSL